LSIDLQLTLSKRIPRNLKKQNKKKQTLEICFTFNAIPLPLFTDERQCEEQ
jgi:hypothetical protein